MTDIIENNSPLKTTDIRPLEVPGRVPIYVYCTSFKGTRQLSRYGDVGYVSQKGHFTLVYVDEKELEDKIEQLNQLKFVRKVMPGHMKELSTNFQETFAETNLEIKNEMGLS
ncbi:YlbG family protein [Lactococcus fujiensis]|uniref:YlbG family protein n=1 Tax=Lactococcus fujiensis TaxID=610251 RepID=UPI0006D1A9AB|nr:YlbG family protein [Lactococcus fujiensis]